MRIDINGLRNELVHIINGQNQRVLFKARPVINQTLNFDLLNYMIKKRKKGKNTPPRGVIINLMRAHPYLLSIMEKKGIDTKNITFIDALFNISGDSRRQSDKAILLPTPFARDFEAQVFKILEEQKDVDFVMIDDIVALQNYWNLDRIETFLEKLSMVLSALGDPPVMIVADSTKDERIITAAGSICDRVIEVDGLKGTHAPASASANS